MAKQRMHSSPPFQAPPPARVELRVIHGVINDVKPNSFPSRNRIWSIGLGLFLLGFVALGVDLPVARYCLARRTPGALRELIERGESYGHAYGVLLICVSFGILSSAGWPAALRLGGVALAGGIGADFFKTWIVRIRPCQIGPEITAIGETFLGFTYSHRALAWNSAYHSLPSAHTATAVALACGLGYLLPRGRWWFFALAALTAAQRIEGGAHFVSDTCWGACVGWLVGQWVSVRLFTRRVPEAPPLASPPLPTTVG